MADVAVTGEIRLPDKEGWASSTLTLDNGQHIELSWQPFRAENTTTVTGSVDGRPFTVQPPTT